MFYNAGRSNRGLDFDTGDSLYTLSLSALSHIRGFNLVL